MIRELGDTPRPLIGRVLYHWICGETDQAADWYERAINGRDPFALVFAEGPLGSAFRESSRWPKLAGMMKLPSPRSDMPLSIGSRIGAYEITDTLGAGGIGEVYRARDTTLDQIAVWTQLVNVQPGGEGARTRVPTKSTRPTRERSAKRAPYPSGADSRRGLGPRPAWRSGFCAAFQLGAEPLLLRAELWRELFAEVLGLVHGRISISDCSPGIGSGQRRTHSTASSIDLTCQSQ